MAADQPRVRTLARLVASLLLFLALAHAGTLAWRSRAMPYLGSLHDDSIYWVTAKSLAEGQGYRILSLPGQPSQTKYPPLYPFVLSLVWRAWPTYPQNLPQALAVNFVVFLALVLILFRLYRSFHLAEPAALLLCAMFALDPYINVLATALMSELLFLLLMLSSTLLSERASACPHSRWAFAAGILAGLAFLTRTAGLPVLVTSPLVFVLQRRYRQAAVFAGAMLPWILGWSAWTRWHYHPPSDFVGLFYLDYLGEWRHFFSLSDVPTIAFTNSLRMWEGFATLLGVGLSPGFSIVVGTIAVAGTFLVIRSSGRWHYAAFALGCFVELLVWPYPQGRLSVALLPLLLAGLWQAFSTSFQFSIRILKDAAIWKTVPAFGIILGEVAFACVWLLSTAGGLNALQNRPTSTGEWMTDAYRWIAEHTSPDSIVIARRDCVMYLNTARASFFPFVSPRLFYWHEARPFGEYSSVAEIARRHNARYVFVSDSDGEGGLPLIVSPNELADHRVYREVFSNPSTRIYEVLQR